MMQGLCEISLPGLVEVEPDHIVRCHLYTEEGKAWMLERGEKKEIGQVPKAVTTF